MLFVSESTNYNTDGWLLCAASANLKSTARYQRYLLQMVAHLLYHLLQREPIVRLNTPPKHITVIMQSKNPTRELLNPASWCSSCWTMFLFLITFHQPLSFFYIYLLFGLFISVESLISRFVLASLKLKSAMSIITTAIFLLKRLMIVGFGLFCKDTNTRREKYLYREGGRQKLSSNSLKTTDLCNHDIQANPLNTYNPTFYRSEQSR